VVDFHHVAVIKLRAPSGETRADTVQLLRHLAELLPAPEAHFDIHLAVAELHLAEGQYAEAAEQVEHAKAVMPEDDKAARALSSAYVDLAAYFNEAGDQAQARAFYKEALTANPSSESAQRELDKISPRGTFPRFPDLLPIGPLRQDANP
jgi:tetratricopeptide (TPR) repeat protein